MSTLLEQASLVMIPSGYKEDVVYSQIPTSGAGDLSFTRASNGTRVNSAGLVEVAPWNLLEQSETIGVSPWGVSGYTQTTNATTAPNGTNTAELFTLNNGNVAGPSYSILQALVLSGEITISVYFKNNNSTGKYVLQTGAGQGSEINVVTLAITNFAGCVGSVENVGNGWYRFSTFIPSASNPYFFSYQDGMTGDGSKGIYLWGAQVNFGTLKPYFPTTDRLNVPRLTYQNGGGGCPSLLLEKQSTNSILYSEDITNVQWANAGGTATANTAISPDGTQNADTLTGARYQGGGASNTWTFSCYAKKVDGDNKFLLRLDVPSTNYAQFDLSTGIIDTISSGYSATITPVGNGWYRCTLTTPSSTSISNIVLVSASGGTYSTYVWGAQIEASSYPTSYIPTTSSSATRVADACYKTGISSLIGQTEGVVFYDGYLGNEMSEIYAFLQETLGNSITSSMYLQYTGGQITWLGWNASTVQQWAIGGGGYTIGQRIKIAGAYKANDIVLYVNGTQIGTDTSATIPTCTSLQLGSYPALPSDAIYRISKPINEVILFPTRLTNAELASITTI